MFSNLNIVCYFVSTYRCSYTNLPYTFPIGKGMCYEILIGVCYTIVHFWIEIMIFFKKSLETIKILKKSKNDFIWKPATIFKAKKCIFIFKCFDRNSIKIYSRKILLPKWNYIFICLKFIKNQYKKLKQIFNSISKK